LIRIIANGRATAAAAATIFSSWKSQVRRACSASASPTSYTCLPGNALLTRRVKAKSARFAVVVRFSGSRRRYERRGLLIEAHALTEAERALNAEAAGSAAVSDRKPKRTSMKRGSVHDEP